MAPKDIEKTTFVTMWDTFCYKLVPFKIEFYVDDMIAKSQTEDEHVTNLKTLFEQLRKFQLKLNLAEYTFGVSLGKLLDLWLASDELS
ncbi:hypothetical protein GQ457_02G028560 [Hibiscus cannabinus]